MGLESYYEEIVADFFIRKINLSFIGGVFAFKKLRQFKLRISALAEDRTQGLRMTFIKQD